MRNIKVLFLLYTIECWLDDMVIYITLLINREIHFAPNTFAKAKISYL